MTYEEALGLWASSGATCSWYYSSPAWKDGIPSLYLYSGFVASSEGWSGGKEIFTFRGLLDGATQYDFGGSAWPPALSQILFDQESSDFIEYLSKLVLTTFVLKYALSYYKRQRVGETRRDSHRI